MASDERLEAGRHHLDNGIRALRQGFLDESRSHFEAALIQFRGPELRLGEAHALRGMGELELHSGHLDTGEQAVRASMEQYSEVRNQLDRIDHEHISHELRRDAEEGEASAHVLLGEILLREGRVEEARQILSYAHGLFGSLGEDLPSSAGVYLALARLGVREGRSRDARGAADRAVTILARCGDTAGQAGAWLLVAEIERLSGNLQEAGRALDHATRLADESRQPSLMGRCRSQKAGLLAQSGELSEALAAYDDALRQLRQAGEVEMEAFALVGRGDVRSKLDDRTALLDLVEGARLLAQLDNRHGLAAAMLRLAEHAVRVGLPAWGLAAAECARQAWQVSDPLRGVGQALRVQVKALAALKKWPAVVTVAHARAALVGDTQPNAVDVREFYRERSPAGLLAELDLQDPDQLVLRAESMVEGLLSPIARQLDLDPQALGTVGGAVAVLNAIAKSTPEPAPARSLAPEAPLAARVEHELALGPASEPPFLLDAPEPRAPSTSELGSGGDPPLDGSPSSGEPRAHSASELGSGGALPLPGSPSNGEPRAHSASELGSGGALPLPGSPSNGEPRAHSASELGSGGALPLPGSPSNGEPPRAAAEELVAPLTSPFAVDEPGQELDDLPTEHDDGDVRR